MIETTDAYGLTFSYPAADQTIGPCLRDYGEFSRMGITLAGQMARGRGFLDVGANIGVFALPISRSASSVVAIEAHPGLAELLRTNVERNSAKNVQVIHAAAGAHPGKVDFPNAPLTEPMNFGSLGVGRYAGDTTPVDVVRLDDVAPADVAVVKIDVEGFELEVLKGAKRLLEQVRPRWMIEFSEQALVPRLRDAGYRTYWFYDAFVTPKAPKKWWPDKYLGDISVFAIPADAPQPVGMIETLSGADLPPTTAGYTYLKSFGFPPSSYE